MFFEKSRYILKRIFQGIYLLFIFPHLLILFPFFHLIFLFSLLLFPLLSTPLAVLRATRAPAQGPLLVVDSRPGLRRQDPAHAASLYLQGVPEFDRSNWSRIRSIELVTDPIDRIGPEFDRSNRSPGVHLAAQSERFNHAMCSHIPTLRRLTEFGPGEAFADCG